MRPVWKDFIGQFGRLSGPDMERRFHRAEQYLHDAGVYYREYDHGFSRERAWPLSHIPVLLSEEDWAGISAALVQRANLLEAILADLYGPNHLVADGHLPAALVAAMPEWLRPMVGVTPRSGHYLHFIAFEIGRGPDGRWWVLGDRTQAPTGAGFAVENRVAMSRMFPEYFADRTVAKIGGFFSAFRSALEYLSDAAEGGVGVLTPGMLNQGYFEHAYIARYLGFMLLEGEDLVVRDGRVMVRTVNGLQPISVIWRRIDSAWADPLELNEASRLGTPGLAGAVRQGAVTMVNALGSGVLETRAMLAFIPRICQALTGEPLQMPNIATWWCGQGAERSHVQANTDRMMIASALATRLPFDSDGKTVLGGRFRDSARGPIADWIAAEGGNLVGQEVVRLSTTPAWDGAALVPRPMSLRVFAARTSKGWTLMPGGYARVGRDRESTAISLQRGGSVADVWLLADPPGAQTAIAEARSSLGARPDLSLLPSRAADNLYWLGRYVERAEGTMRLLRAFHVRLADNAAADMPLQHAIAEALTVAGVDVAEPVPGALTDMLDAAVQSAAQVRDRFSVDGWLALKELQGAALLLAENHLSGELPRSGDDIAREISGLLRQVTGFSGLVQDNMYRFTGWRFLSIGRALERSMDTCAMLARFCDEAAPEGGLDLAVELGDSGITHRRRYTIATNRQTVIDLLALDGRNPRGLLYQLNRMRTLCERLPGAENHGRLADFYRAVIRVQTDIELQRPQTLDSQALWKTRGELMEVSNLLTQHFFR
ncbi:circularly permuted type 2 ATP-grasp protein [Mangrovicoccus sp. HB182678]|uniref:Circularly permuted type 2 ATP-grasp protein n=2 Tax=Mangrovicoccus algicola TaxID=2771008 RepID=A0A8J6YSU9_9RHOB|nr:circularly permuted type 2 ATP-grasp protein [Mangrovicoccus algicola]